MSELIKVPGIGDGEGEVIEILIEVGDSVEVEQSLVTLESDKASMEIPSPQAGIVKSIKVKLGDKLKEGDELLELEQTEEPQDQEASDATSDKSEETADTEELKDQTEPSEPSADEDDDSDKPANKTSDKPPAEDTTEGSQDDELQSFNVPDIGEGEAQVIEILVKTGDQIEAEQSLFTLESDKASMEIPAPASGTIESIDIELNQQVKSGDPMLHMRVQRTSEKSAEQSKSEQSTSSDKGQSSAKEPQPSATDKSHAATQAQTKPTDQAPRDEKKVHAGPAVRKLAREFGVQLSAVEGSGPRNRILKEDVQVFVQKVMQQTQDGKTGGAIPSIPEVDFSRFGETEVRDMTRLQQIGATNLHRSWLNVPHVTQFDTADISELDAFRKAQQAVAEKAGVKLTLLPFLLKACAHLLREQPDFNVSLAPNGKQLIQKHYVHLGFAVDTEEGLLVPVIRDVDKKSVLELAAEAAELAEKARNKKLNADAMQGACFTISSIGHIGGSYFTPIVNSPEVAILGVSRATTQPAWDGNTFQPRLILPLSLSYDHRAINGAAAVQFTKRLGELLGDIRSLLL